MTGPDAKDELIEYSGESTRTDRTVYQHLPGPGHVRQSSLTTTGSPTTISAQFDTGRCKSDVLVFEFKSEVLIVHDHDGLLVQRRHLIEWRTRHVRREPLDLLSFLEIHQMIGMNL